MWFRSDRAPVQPGLAAPERQSAVTPRSPGTELRRKPSQFPVRPAVALHSLAHRRECAKGRTALVWQVLCSELANPPFSVPRLPHCWRLMPVSSGSLDMPSFIGSCSLSSDQGRQERLRVFSHLIEKSAGDRRGLPDTAFPLRYQCGGYGYEFSEHRLADVERRPQRPDFLRRVSRGLGDLDGADRELGHVAGC